MVLKAVLAVRLHHFLDGHVLTTHVLGKLALVSKGLIDLALLQKILLALSATRSKLEKATLITCFACAPL